MKLRNLVLAALTTLVTTISASPAIALTQRDDGDEPGALMSAGDAALIFLGIPVGIFVVLVILIWAPSRGKSKSTELSNY
ncbi:MAG: hypothetical protein RIT32_246 [Actinomycetota bacterium]|jgi:hypothetical protein